MRGVAEQYWLSPSGSLRTNVSGRQKGTPTALSCSYTFQYTLPLADSKRSFCPAAERAMTNWVGLQQSCWILAKQAKARRLDLSSIGRSGWRLTAHRVRGCGRATGKRSMDSRRLAQNGQRRRPRRAVTAAAGISRRHLGCGKNPPAGTADYALIRKVCVFRRNPLDRSLNEQGLGWVALHDPQSQPAASHPPLPHMVLKPTESSKVLIICQLATQVRVPPWETRKEM